MDIDGLDMKTAKQNLALINRKRKRKVSDDKTKAEIIPLGSSSTGQMIKKCSLSQLFEENVPSTIICK